MPLLSSGGLIPSLGEQVSQEKTLVDEFTGLLDLCDDMTEQVLGRHVSS